LARASCICLMIVGARSNRSRQHSASFFVVDQRIQSIVPICGGFVARVGIVVECMTGSRARNRYAALSSPSFCR
jgi:hypothetical protein